MDKTATILVGAVEMRYNHSRRFPFDPDMVRLEIALVSNWKRRLERNGYEVAVEVYDNLDTRVAHISAEDAGALYDEPVDWEYTDKAVAEIINEYIQ